MCAQCSSRYGVISVSFSVFSAAPRPPVTLQQLQRGVVGGARTGPCAAFYYRQLTLPMPELSTLLNPHLTLPILYIKSSTLLTVGLSIVVSCVAGLSKMIDRWKDDFMLLKPLLTTTPDDNV